MDYCQARLTIRIEDDQYLSLELDWPGCEKQLQIAKVEAPETWLVAAAHPFSELLDSLVFEDLENLVVRSSGFETYLSNIGWTIWSEVFKKAEGIHKALQEFDKMARSDWMLASNSQMVLIIDTDILFVPWELCVFPPAEDEQPPEKEPDWFKQPICLRYEVVRCNSGDTPKKLPRRRADERKRMLLLHGLPSPDEFAHELKRELGTDAQEGDEPKAVVDYGSAHKELCDLIDDLTKKGVEIDFVHEDTTAADNKILGLGNCYDFIMFIGPFEEGKGKKKMGRMLDSSGRFKLEVANIECDNHYEPVIFLDGCKTAEVRYSPISDFSQSGQSVASELLKRGASSYIGVIHKVEPVVAARFASRVLGSIFGEGLSLAEAMYDARKHCYVSFDEKRHQVAALLYTLQTSQMGVDQVLKSLRYGHKPNDLHLIFPRVVSRYFEGFPHGIRSDCANVVLAERSAFSDVVKEVLGINTGPSGGDDAIVPFIADWPIMAAAKHISETRKDPENRLVVIGALFRLTQRLSDGFLYYREDRLEESTLLNPYFLSTVTAASLLYLDSIGFGDRYALRPALRLPLSYDTILNIAEECLLNGDYERFEAFILAGPYDGRFQKALNSLEKMEESDIKTVYSAEDKRTKKINRIVRIDLSEFLFRSVKGHPEQPIIMGLPASVLVARLKDVDEYLYLYKRIMDKWQRWRSGILAINPEVAATQDVIHTWTDVDRKSVIEFTRFIEAALGKYLEIPSLEPDDFISIRAGDRGANARLDELKDRTRQRMSGRIERMKDAVNSSLDDLIKDERTLILSAGTKKEKKEARKRASKELQELLSEIGAREEKWVFRIRDATSVDQVDKVDEELEAFEIQVMKQEEENGEA